MLRRIFCPFFALVVLLSASVPALAAGAEWNGSVGVPVELGVDVVSLADMAFKGGVGTVNFIRSFFDEDTCPLCTDLTAQHDFQPKRTLVNGQVGVYYVCRYCGMSAGEVFERTYQDYVETLPGKQCNSSGAFCWKPGVADFVSTTVQAIWPYYYNRDTSVSLSFDLKGAFPSGSRVTEVGYYVKTTLSAVAYVGDCVSTSTILTNDKVFLS